MLDETYEIRRVLGRGGMGQVFEAHDRLLNRSVAIKLPWSHIGIEPLMQEAQALAALRGRGVPSVYAVGKYDDSRYYVMERMYGRTLAEHMVQRFADGRFTIEEAVEILIGIANALAEVHRAGLVHRDLKPSNIMLAPADRVVLLDFGLFLTESNAGSDPVICGSPRYIAPEVVTASVRSGLAHLIDVYALGIIAFTLLAGFVPFDDLSMTRLLAKHVHTAPPPLSAIRPDSPVRLTRIIGDMLEKEPQERTFSAEAVASGLTTILDDIKRTGPIRGQATSGRRIARVSPIQ
ncbi:MAG: serine/threonine protein kinase [Proteobacteria bacterium]|nr:serine/threonine protein kinase [Pseudomonadota bacterium]